MSRYRVFACEVLFREMCIEAAQTPHTIDLTFNRYGLHHVGSEKMAGELQALVDSVQEKKYDAILFGYALCSNGIIGLKSRDIPIVIPRAHDCITLLLGSREKYDVEFSREAGTYYRSPGWWEHLNLEKEDSVGKKLGTNLSYAEMVEKYGEENAKYLQETLGNLGTHKETYTRIAYIDTGVGPKDDLIDKSRKEAESNGWRLDIIQGSRTLIRKLLSGNWNTEEFLVVDPGQVVKPTYDKMIIGV